MRRLLAALLLLAAPLAGAGEREALPPPQASPARDPEAALLWSLLPGAGHIWLGDTATGVTYAALTGALLAGGTVVQAKNDDLGREDEVNVLWIAGEKVWEYSIFTTYRSALTAAGIDLRARNFDDTPTARLLAAPFQAEQLLHPAVWGVGLLGAGLAAAAAHDREGGRLNRVTRAQMFGDDFNRDRATALVALSSFSVSLGAATAEEGLFRGLLQPMLEERLGPAAGLWATAGTFGLAHIVGVDGELNPEGVAVATLAGAYLGWLYDRQDHRLAVPIAAHFWYDFMIFATSWALEPDDTPFGFDVQFRF